LEASKEYNIPEIKLVRAIHDAPSILSRFSRNNEKYIAYIQKELLKHFKNDNVVYHGLAGHFFVKGVSHVLKVRIIADLEDRVKLEMEREGISREEALHTLRKDDDERRKWSHHLYDIDPWDPCLYDLVIHIHKISVDDAVNMICHAAGLEDLKATPESRQAMADLVLAAEVKAALVNINPELEVVADDGHVVVRTEARLLHEETHVQDLEKVLKSIQGVKDFRIEVGSDVPLSD
jgi:cytidylate kinase